MWEKCCGDARLCQESGVCRVPKNGDDIFVSLHSTATLNTAVMCRNVWVSSVWVAAHIVKCPLSHTVCISSAVLLWRGQSTHSLRRPWSAGMPVSPLRHSMASEVLAFIHVINSVKPCLKAPHASLCSQGWPTLPRCGKHSYVTAAAYFHSHPLPCIIFGWGGRRNYFHVDTH